MYGNVLRIISSFSVVAVAYWLYSLLAVPLLEPAIARGGPQQSDAAARPSIAKAAVDRHLADLQPLLPPGCWELDKPKVLETETGKLLFKDYKPLPDGRVEVTPFTLVFLPSSTDAAEEKETDNRDRRPVVLRAPHGALLQFDRPLDLSRAEIGRLVGGRLLGEIKIFSPPTARGDDGIEIETNNIQIEPQRVWTPHPVRFRYGESFGRGRDLTINLLTPEGGGSRGGQVDVQGVKSLELVHVEKIHLQTSRGNLAEAPIEVSCRGPFLFDFEKNVASFEDRVDVLRLHADGPSDQLSCEALELYLGRAGQGTEKNSLSELELQRMVAVGHPVVLRAPSMDMTTRGTRLEYDLKSNRIRLDDDNRVMLKHRDRQVEAATLEYEFDDPNRVGRLWALGPGRLDAKVGDDPPQQFSARWAKELRLQPQNGNHLVSLVGGAGVNVSQAGGFSADEIHLWLNEKRGQSRLRGRGPQPRFHLEPDRMLAVGNVRIHSPQLTGSTKRLEAWFENRADDRVASAGAARNAPAGARGLQPRAGQSSPQFAEFGTSDSIQRFDLQGQLMRIRLVRQRDRTDVRDVTVEGNVRLVETGTAEFEQLPLIVTGRILELRGGASPDGVVRVIGRPARISARGLRMAGRSVQLDRGQNHLSINSPGEMNLPADRDLQGRPLAQREEIKITWGGRMEFDGRIASFQRNVRVEGRSQFATGDLLEATLGQRIDFAAPQRPADADLRQLAFRGPCYLENRSVQSGELSAVDKMQLNNLRVDQFTGRIHADGPGWLTSVRYGQRGADPLAVAPPAGAADESRLNYLRVDFQRELTGNIHRREVQFVDQVKAVYGPVGSWDEQIVADRKDALGPQGVQLTCERLTVAEPGPPTGDRRAIELLATGNTLIEGRQFTARCQRLSYADAKRLLILEGTGRTDAELWRQPRTGGATSYAAARKILYWRDENRVEVDDASVLNLSQAPSSESR